MQFAKLIADSDLAPKDYRGKPANVLVAIQMGADVGLSPMQALQNIAVINGRPTIWGDAMLAICQAHPECEDVIEACDGTKATCVVRRRGRQPLQRDFSVDDAKKAGLWGKTGPWQQYPARMLQMRARGFALRDAFADALRGLQLAEEVRDYRVDDKQAVVDAPPPAALPASSASKPASTPPPADSVVFFGKLYPTWGGRAVHEAPASVVLEYMIALDAVLKDASKKRVHAKTQEHLSAVECVYEGLVTKELDAIKAASRAHADIGGQLQALRDSETSAGDDSSSYLDDATKDPEWKGDVDK
jgi:hypothetical protein